MDGLPPWSLIQGVLVQLVLPAFGASALVLAITCLVTKSATFRLAGAAAAFTAGLALGNHFHHLIEWWPRRSGLAGALGLVPWWAIERGWPALLPVTVFAALIGMPSALLARHGWFWGTALRVVAAAGAAWWLAEALPPLPIPWTIGILFAAIVLDHEALVLASRQTSGRFLVPTIMIIWGATAATVLIFAHSARFSDLATLMTASVCGAGLTGALWKVEPAVHPAGPSTFVPPLMLAGATNTFSEVPLAAFACVAFAPSILWLLQIPQVSRWASRRIVLATILALLIPCAAAVLMAVWTEQLEF
jgi:hypothetical protein